MYDDDPSQPLQDFLTPHNDYITVINWWGQTGGGKTHRKGNQLTAYNHAVQNFISPFEWAAFIDGDEFIVLRQHTTIHDFLFDFKDEVAVSLNWYAFGHNGFYNDPTGLITTCLNRRMFSPFSEIKTI